MPDKGLADLEAAIFEHIRQAGNITFVGIQQNFGRGDFGIYLTSLNVILWGGLKEEVCHALISLKTKGRIKYGYCSVLVYILEGRALIHPVAITAPPEGGFKELCWIPIVISVDDSKLEGEGGNFILKSDSVRAAAEILDPDPDRNQIDDSVRMAPEIPGTQRDRIRGGIL